MKQKPILKSTPEAVTDMMLWSYTESVKMSSYLSLQPRFQLQDQSNSIIDHFLPCAENKNWKIFLWKSQKKLYNNAESLTDQLLL